jgi:hypothetical protein
MEKETLEQTIKRVLADPLQDSLTDPEKRLVALTMGQSPETTEEKELARQISELREAGKIVEIPAM